MPASNLLNDISETDTTLPMLSSAPFVMPARVLIQGEFVRCQTKVEGGPGPDQLTSCERGTDQDLGGAMAAAHVAGTLVVQDDRGLRDIPCITTDPSAEVVNTAAFTLIPEHQCNLRRSDVAPGKVLRLDQWGVYRSAATPITLAYYVLLGGTDSSHILAYFPTLAPPASGNGSTRWHLVVSSYCKLDGGGNPIIVSIARIEFFGTTDLFVSGRAISATIVVPPEDPLPLMFAADYASASASDGWTIVDTVLESVN